jgi:HK97 gp10 family phage protein
VEIEYNTKEVANLFKKLPEDMQERVVRNALTASGRKFAKSANAAAPFDPRPDGTNIRGSVKVYWDRKNKELSVGIKSRGKGAAYYAHMIEYGTVKMSPRPFFGPTYLSEVSLMTALIVTNVVKGISKQIKRYVK